MIQSIQKTNFSKHGNSRSRHQRGSVGKGVIRNFTKFTGNHRCQSLFLNKVAVLSIKKTVHRFFMFDINLARNEYCRAIYVDFEIKNRFVNKNGETKYLVLHSVLPVNKGFQ